ncbi:MAG: sigma 54-dependent Fis family transcriptional regulator [Deltaproteobacteria bacterium]|nr:sigma 54-dependent Fis family transcriptional regulator [Deltaproteobacteria bacterium]
MQTTLPRATISIPLRTLRVRVVAGPDAGAEAVSDDEPITVGSADACALRLSDRTVSRFHVELAPTAGGVRVRDLGSTNGVRSGAVRILDAVVPSGARIAVGASELSVEDAGLRSIETRATIPGLVGDSPAARVLAWRAERAAQSDAPVLILGESGTGKELVARALHARSPRASGPFVVVDGGSLAPTLVASELFGHEKGAFTGARERREGALERAHGGTLFLDEIGELPAAVQPLLLGALARGVTRRVGGERELPIDVRVVSATHRDLRAAVNSGAFRADLYHRIAVVRVSVPALRARADDVPALVEHFLRAAGWTGPRETIVDDDVLARWCDHPWPGNVRELRNATLAALAMREAPELDPVAGGPFAELLGRPFRDARDDAMARFERRYLESLLERTRQNVAEAARHAGIDRTHLHELLKRHGIR